MFGYQMKENKRSKRKQQVWSRVGDHKKDATTESCCMLARFSKQESKKNEEKKEVARKEKQVARLIMLCWSREKEDRKQ